MRRLFARYVRIALPFTGSAILLFSCERAVEQTGASDESIMTEYSDNLTVLMSQNGRRSYHFTTPLLEGYSLAKEPYREFRKGVKITTYKNDSLTSVDAELTANYAIYFETRQLWEAKGNVVVEKSDGKTLYTQQLFWDQRTKKIYSNVDSKIVQSGGRDVFVGEGFESDEEFKDWRFRRMKGRMEVEVIPSERPDSVRSGVPAAADSDARPTQASSGSRDKQIPADAPKRSADDSGAAAAPRGSGRAPVPPRTGRAGEPGVELAPVPLTLPEPDASAISSDTDRL